jgi:7,8-dihydro-6-hydroxymethylpterin-pyrophosphokinase
MQHLVSPAETEKQALHTAIELQVQQFLDHGGKITVVNTSSATTSPPRGDVWQHGFNSAAFSEMADNALA